MDRYGEIYTRPLLAPTVLLISPILRASGYELNIYNDIPFLPWLILHQIDFDQKNESLDELDDQGSYINPGDIWSMRTGYAISKLVTLFSMPLWALYALFIVKGLKGKVFTRMLVTIVLVALCASSVISWVFLRETSGTEHATWKIMLQS